jgi:hypothetical protein
MADQQHLDLLKQGVDTLNTWRKEHPDITIDLYAEKRVKEIAIERAKRLERQ